jgi:hypothetical protein
MLREMQMGLETDILRMAQRQDIMIAAITSLGETMAITSAMVEKVLEWMQKPAGAELRDALQNLAAAVEANTAVSRDLAKRMAGLPADVARAVTTGEVR